MAALELHTTRLTLRALDAEDLDAWIAGDAARLVARTGARFPAVVEAPPLLGDDLPMFRDLLRLDPGTVGWNVWLFVLREGDEPVGAAGLFRPDAEGAVFFGYTIFPRFERQGLTTEAMRALLAWILRQPMVRRARASIPPWNVASVRVAEKLGMVRVGTAKEPHVGEVWVYEIEKTGKGEGCASLVTLPLADS